MDLDQPLLKIGSINVAHEDKHLFSNFLVSALMLYSGYYLAGSLLFGVKNTREDRPTTVWVVIMLVDILTGLAGIATAILD